MLTKRDEFHNDKAESTRAYTTSLGNNWWAQENGHLKQGSKEKWSTMEHNGVSFPENYSKHNAPVLYRGKRIKVSSFQEELATYWTQTLGTDWLKNPYYRQNFSKLFLGTFDKKPLEFESGDETEAGDRRSERLTLDPDFDEFDFSKVKEHFERRKQEKASMSKEQKEKIKRAREQNEIGLKYAVVDKILERVSNFRIEPRTLFKGRGEHPKAGTLKPKIFPEDVHINLSRCSQTPICLKPGHSWGSVVFEKKTTWLSSYAAEGGHKKYVFLGAGSKMKGMNDVKKYEKARELKKKIEEVKANYYEKMNSASVKQQMLGTATYLIDTLAIRVGNEKNDDEADTVGCCSLRKEHLTFEEDNTLVLDFYGKDSMRFFKKSGSQ